MHKILLILIVTIFSTTSYAAEFTDEQCSAAIVGIETTPDQITKQSVAIFLESLTSNTCRGSVEYSGWSNEAIFNVMQKSPTIFFEILRKSSASIKNQVQQKLTKPIHDGINYPEINNSISKIKDSALRNYALNIFNPLLKKHLSEVNEWEKKNNQKWSYGG
jgi:hypothetical protein